MLPVSAALAFHRVTGIDLSLCDGFEQFIAYYFAMGAVQGYSVDKTLPVRFQKV